MNGKLLAILSAIGFAVPKAIALTTGLSPLITQAQTPQLVISLRFNNNSLNQPRESAPPSPTDRGAPRDRKGGASFAT
jgi:hypothetical protein